MRFFWIACLQFFVVGCSTVHHQLALEDPEAFSAGTKIVVGDVSNSTGEDFDVDIEKLLREAMDEELRSVDLLAESIDDNTMKMNINIIEYRKGDAFKRWLWPGYGSTVLVIESHILDADGNVDATAQANRSVDAGGGYTIGAWKDIFKDVSKDLVSDLVSQIQK